MPGEAATAIASLKAAGWSYSQMGNFVGRDVSFISQIARGKKTGAAIAPALHGLAASGRSPMQAALAGGGNVPRKPGRVRESAQAVGTGEKPAYHITTGGNEDIKRFLREADQRGQKVQLTGDFGNVQGKRKYPKRRRGRPQKVRGAQRKRGEVGILQKGGWDAGKLLDRIEHPETGDGWKAGDARGAMREMAVTMGDAEHVGRFNKVEIHAFNP